MNNQPGGRQFEIEELEPRLLLSANLAAVGLGLAGLDAAFSAAGHHRLETGPGPSGAQHLGKTAYSNHRHDLFEDLSSPAAPSPQAAAQDSSTAAGPDNQSSSKHKSGSDQGSGSTAANSQSQTISKSFASGNRNVGVTILRASSPAALVTANSGSTTAAQLITTLKAGRAPPSVASNSAVSLATPKNISANVGSNDLYSILSSSRGSTSGSQTAVTLLNGLFQLGSVMWSPTSGGDTFSSSSGSLSIGSGVTGSFSSVSGTYTSATQTLTFTLSGLTLSISSFINFTATSVSVTLSENPQSPSINLSNGTTTNATAVMTLSAAGATLFAGLGGPATNSSAIGVTLTGVNVQLGLVEGANGYTYYGLGSTGGTAGAVGLPSGLSFSSTNLSFQANGSTDPIGLVANFMTSPALSSLGLQFDTPLLEAGGTITLAIGSASSSFTSLTGSLEIETLTVSASAPQVTLNGNPLAGTQILTIGGTGLNAFVGINAGTSTATGVELDGVSIGMAIMSYGGKTYWGLDSTAATAALVGLPSLTLSASSLTVQVNQSDDMSGPGGAMVVADFSALQVATGAANPSTVTLSNLTPANGAIEEFGGTVTISFGTSAGSFVIVTGSVAVESEIVPAGEVTLSSGTLDSTMLTIGGTGLNLFAGIDGALATPAATTAPYFTGHGVELDGVSFGLAVVEDGSGYTYWGLESTASSAELIGLPKAVTLSASSLTVELNQSTNGTGAAMVTADFAALPVLEGGSQAGSMSLSLSGQLAEATGNVTLSLDGFVMVMGTIAVESESVAGQVTLSDGTLDSTMLSIGGNVSIFAGINGALTPGATAAPYFTGTGVELDNATFGLAIVTAGANTYWGLEATAAAARLDGLPSSWTAAFQSITVELNQSTDPSGTVANFSGFSVPTGASSPATVALSDLTASALLEVSATVDLNIGGGPLVQGIITVASETIPMGLKTSDGAAVAAGTMLTIAATNLNVFAGVNGSFNSSEQIVPGIGVEVAGESFGLVIIQSGGFTYWAVASTQTGTATFYGLPSGITATASSLSLQVNQSSNFSGTNSAMVVVDFSTATVSIPGSSVTLAYVQPMLQASATVSLSLGSYVIVNGTMAVSSQTISGGLTLTNGTTLTTPGQTSPELSILTIGGSNISAFFGVNGSYGNGSYSGTGLELDGASFGLVLAEDSTGTHHYWALQAQGGTLKLDGLSGLNVSATSLNVELNQSDDTSGTGGSMVVVDFTKVPMPSGQTSPGLAVPTGSNTPVYVDFSQPTESVAGAASIGWGTTVSLSGNFIFILSTALTNEVFEVGETNLNFNLKAGSTSVVSFNQTPATAQNPGQTGAFVIFQSAGTTTIAGQAALQFQSGLVGISGTIQLDVNTTNGPVTASVTTADGTNVPINFTSGTPSFEVAVTSGYIHLGSLSFPFPNFTVTIDSNTGDIDLSQGSTMLVTVDSSGNVTTPGISSLVNNVSSLLSNLDNPTAGQLVQLLQQLGTWLVSLTSSGFLNTTIPFTGGTTLAQVFNWSQAFINNIYNQLVTEEFPSSMVQLGSEFQSSTVQLGSTQPSVTFTNDTLGLQLGKTALRLTLNGTYTFTELVSTLNNEISTSALAGDITVGWDENGFLSIELTSAGMQAIGSMAPSTTTPLTFSMTSASAGFNTIGFSVGSGSSPVNAAVESLYNFNVPSAVLTQLPNTPTFFQALENVLQGLPGVASGQTQPSLMQDVNGTEVMNGQEIYTFPVSFKIPLASLALPFSLGSSFGSIGSASLTGQLNLTATVSASFTLGFDMSASAPPTILSSATVPVPANGQIAPTQSGTNPDDIVFTVILNGDNSQPITVSLPVAMTTGNTSISDLVSELNTQIAAATQTYTMPGSSTPVTVDTAMYTPPGSNSTPIPLSQIIQATASGNQISISVLPAYLGVVNTLELSADTNNSFVTELGFGSQIKGTTSYSVATSPMKGLFIEGTGSGAPSFTGSLAVTTTTPISGSLQLGFVTVSTSGGVVGTYLQDGTTQNPLSITVSLQNQTDGSSQLYLSALLTALTSGNISSMITVSKLSGSFLAELNNISVTGLGSLVTLPANAQIAVWIPDITNLNFNSNTYDASDPNASTGIFITLPDVGSSLTDLSDLSFAQIIQALQGVASSLGQLSQFSFLNDPLPLIGKSIDQLIDYATEFTTMVTNLDNNAAQTLQGFVANLNTQIDQIFHLNPNVLAISLDTSGTNGPALEFKLKLTFAYANSLPFSLNLQQLVNALPSGSAAAQVLSLATSLVSASAMGNLSVSVGATLTLDFGLDLSNPSSIQPFFYNDTGVALTAKVTGTNLKFDISLGSVPAVSIAGGSVGLSLDGNTTSNPAQINLGLNGPNGRLYLSGDWLSSSNIILSVEGGVQANLPISVAGISLGTLALQIPDLYRLITDEAQVSVSASGTATINVLGMNGGVVGLMLTGLSGISTVVLDDSATATAGTVTAAVSGTTLTITVASNDSTLTVGDIQTALQQVGANYNVTTSANDQTQALSTSTVYVSSLNLPDLNSLFSGLNFDNLLQNPALFLQGLNQLLGVIEDGLNGLALNGSLPLVGKGLVNAADFIQTFRTGLLTQLTNDLNSAGGNFQGAIQNALWDVLGGGTGGLNILYNPNKPTVLLTSAQQISVQFNALTGLSVDILLAGSYNPTLPVNVNIGVPGLSFTSTGNVTLSVGYSLLLDFGLNTQDGFYFKTPDNLTLTFSATIPGLQATGTLGFLQLQVADEATSNYNMDNAVPSIVMGQFQITLVTPGGGNMLTTAAMSSDSVDQMVQVQYSVNADLNLALVASFGGNAAFPSFDADFHLLWSLTQNGAGTPAVSFTNVALDLGTFISGFLGPILNEVQQVTEPIQPILTLITAPIPILSSLAGSPVTLLSLAQDFGFISPGTAEFITEVADIVTLINDIKGIGSGTILIPLGSFSLSANSSGQMQQISVMSQNTNPNLTSMIQQAAAQQASNGGGDNTTYMNSAVGFANTLGSLDGFSFPFLQKPTSLFGVFTGQNVTLMTWQMPAFQFQFTYSQTFPIYPPLFVNFGGTISATINFGFGYDTYGAKELFSDSTHNVADLLDGFYIITTSQTNQPVPALTLSGTIFAGAELDLGIASASVDGDVSATVNFLWNNNSTDGGKMRFDEIAADAAQGAACIFEITGAITVGLEATITVGIGPFSFSKTWDLGQITLVDFSISCPQPILGVVTTGDLTLYMGSLASDREAGNLSGDSQSFVVHDLGSSTGGGESVNVTFDNESNQFTGVTEIYVLNPGGGTNVMDFRGVTVPVNVTCGTGNDTIYLSDGANSVVYCGTGNDTIIASSSLLAKNVVIYGGDGNLSVTAGMEPITIFGSSGNNTITASPNDVIFGGDGNDMITGAGGSDFIVTGAGDNTVNVAGGSADGNNMILADSWLFVMGDLTNVPAFIAMLSQASSSSLAGALWAAFSVSAQQILEGNMPVPASVKGVPSSTPAATLQEEEVTLVTQLDAVLLGQKNLDPNNPLSGTPAMLDLLQSSTYNSSTGSFTSGLFAGVTLSATSKMLLAANPNPSGQVLLEVERSLLADAFPLYVMVRASGGQDVITGGSMGDVIDGGAGNDTITAGAGGSILIAGTGNTQIYGGAGNDLIVGGEVSSISQGSGASLAILPPANSLDSTAGMPGSTLMTQALLALVNNMYVAASSSSTPSSGPGIALHGLTGGGNDLLVGGGGSNAIFGGAGNDDIYGGNLLIAGSTMMTSTPGNNFIAGGTGNDIIFSDDASATTTATPTGISIQSNIWFETGTPAAQAVRTSADTGFSGVTVSLYLYNSSNPNDLGSLVATTTTDASGNFGFEGLNPTNYILVFSLPNGMSFVPASTGNGSNVVNTFTLNSQTVGETSKITLSDNLTFMSVSAGYEAPLPSVSVNNASATESASGQTPMVFTLTLSAAMPYPVVVQYNTADETAIAADGAYTATTGTVTFNPGQTTAQVTVQVDGSTTYNPVSATTQFGLVLGSATETVINPVTNATTDVTVPVSNSGTGTIVNPNLPPAINITSFDPTATSLVSVSDLLGATSLAQMLQAHTDPVSSLLYSDYGTTSQWLQVQQLTFTGSNASTTGQIQNAVIALLNEIIQGQLIYNQSAFAGVSLSTQSTAWLTQTVQGTDLAQLNRFLLDDAYSGLIGGIEGAAGTPETFTVTLTNPSSGTVSVAWQTDIALTANGAVSADSALPTSLTADGNFVENSGTLVFQPGVTSLVITVQTVANKIAQDDLHYYVDLSNPVGASIDQGHAFAIIRNTQPPPSVTFMPVLQSDNVTYAFEDTVAPVTTLTETFTVNLTEASGQTIMVNYSTASGTATDVPANSSTPPAYYVQATTQNGTTTYTQSGTLVFAPGTTSQTFTVQINPNTSGNNTDFFVNLVSATNAVIAATPGASQTIIPSSQSNHMAVNIDTVPPSNLPWDIYFSANSYYVTEPSSGSAVVDITLFRTPDSPDAVAVFYTTNGPAGPAAMDSAAQAGIDYVAVRQLVSFAPGQYELTVPITVLFDNAYDGNKTLTLSLRNPTGGPVTGTPASATLTITQPAPPQIEIVALPTSAVTVVASSPIQYAQFEVELVDGNGNPVTATYAVTFNYFTEDLTAKSGVDYTGIPSTAPYSATIPVGFSDTDISIPILSNSTPEPTKNFAVEITNPVGATLGNSNAAIGTIYNNNTTDISGLVFYDANGSGFFNPPADTGIPVVTVEVTYTEGGGTMTQSVTTTATQMFGSGASYNFSLLVPLGEVSIKVVATSVTGGAGAVYQSTTNNETQQVNFTGANGVLTFAPIGFDVANTPPGPKAGTSQNTGTGNTINTVFGGPGNNMITVGNGNDNVAGGSWMDATDANAPINQGSYNATVVVTNGTWYIDTMDSGTFPATGSITGTVTGVNGPVAGQTLTLYDYRGDPVNMTVTGANGAYAFSGLYPNSSTGDGYYIQFGPPAGDVLTLTGTYTTVPAGGTTGKTGLIPVTSTTPIIINASYGPPTSNAGTDYEGFQFSAPAYSVAEDVQAGFLAITVTRTDASQETPVVLQTFDGTAVQNVNYTRVSTLLEFAVGVTSETVDIPILNTKTLTFASVPLTFTLVLRQPTGAPLDQATVSIGGDGFGTITNNNTIYGGSGLDVIVGHSGYIPSTVDLYTGLTTTSNIVYAGGPGIDYIYAGSGLASYINAEVGTSYIYAGLIAPETGAGNMPQAMEVIDGGLGSATLIAEQDVPSVVLNSPVANSPANETLNVEAGGTSVQETVPIQSASTGTMTFSDAQGNTLGYVSFVNIGAAALLGGAHATTLQLEGWNNPAWVFAGSGGATLIVKDNSSMMTLSAISPAPSLPAFLANDSLVEDSTLTLSNGAVYGLGGLTNVSLTDTGSSSTLNASGYAGSVTFHGNPGSAATMIGGTGQNTFAFDADMAQGPDIISGSGSDYTLDFSSTTTSSITLDLTSTAAQVVNGNLTLTLQTSIQNVIDGQGNNTINASSGVHQIILDPYSGSQMVTITGDGSGTTLNFSAFTSAITVNLNTATQQSVTAGLSLTLVNARVDNIIGGAGGGTLTGNSGTDIFAITGGVNTITGISSSNTVNASANADFTLTGNSLSVGGVVSVLSNIQTVNLTGGLGNDIFDVNGFSGTVNITGGGGSDTVEVQTALQAPNTITVVDSAVTSVNNVTNASGSVTADGLTVNFQTSVSATDSVVVSVIISDTTSPGVTFNASGWTAGSLTLVGASSSAQAQSSASGSTITLTNTAITLPSTTVTLTNVIYLNSITNVTFSDTAGGDIFNVVGGIGGSLTLNGTGTNTLMAQATTAGTITLTNSSVTLGTNGTVVTFTAIQTAVLDANSSGNTFDVTAWTAGNVTLNGNGSNNTVNASGSGTITLTNSSIAFSGSSPVITLNSIQNAVLDGSAGGVTFNVTAWTAGNVTLNGSGTGNTVLAQANSAGEFSVTSGMITFSGNNLAITLNSIQIVTLMGNSSGNTFDLKSWQGGSLTLTFNGTAVSAANTNTFIFNQISSSQTVNATIIGGGNDTLNLSNFPMGTGDSLTIPDASSQTITLQSDLSLTLSGIKHLLSGSGASPQVISQSLAPSASVSVNNTNTTESSVSRSYWTFALTNALWNISGFSAAPAGAPLPDLVSFIDSIITMPDSGTMTINPEPNPDS